MAEPFLGIIGGSGLYEFEGFEPDHTVRPDTPWGLPSGPIAVGRLDGCRVAFLPRHGPGHVFNPSNVPYRANLCALKTLGVDRVLSVSAVGSMKEDIAPGSLVVVDQFVDRTLRGGRTFFEGGIVAHVSFADPVCPVWSQAVHAAATRAGVSARLGGTYVCIEGPQFSTRAESAWFRSLGVDVIGMTALPEARLAREAELPYAVLALVSDYDCWHEEEEDVSVDGVLQVLREATARARRVVRELAAATARGEVSLDDSPARGALSGAIMTQRSAIPPAVRARLAWLVDFDAPQQADQ